MALRLLLRQSLTHNTDAPHPVRRFFSLMNVPPLWAFVHGVNNREKVAKMLAKWQNLC